MKARHQLIEAETSRTLVEVTRHSLARTGTIARAIEAGLLALDEGSVLAERHHQVLEEWVSMVSTCGGVGDRWNSWRGAVAVLLQAINTSCPAGLPGLLEQLQASLTVPQAERLTWSFSEQQRDLLQQAMPLKINPGASNKEVV